MGIVIDASMRTFANKLDISSSRMVEDYGLSTIDEIIKAETARGNSKAIMHAREYASSPDKLIEMFKLADVENKFVIIHNMDERTRLMLLPYLDNHDLVMGMYFFTQEKLLKMLMHVDIYELVRVVLEAFPEEDIIEMMTEEDMACFFMNRDLPKEVVVEQLKQLPDEVMRKFVESLTGQPAEESNPMELINTMAQMPDQEFGQLMAVIDPDAQKQLVYQLTQEDPRYFTLFPNITFVNMLATLPKQEMVKPMVMLNKETLMGMNALLPSDLLSIVACQIDTKDFAKFLQDGHMEMLEKAMMI